MKVVLLPLFLGTLMATGCTTFGGDVIVRVSGSVPMSRLAEKPDQQCRLGLVSVETGVQSSVRDVPTKFSTAMMVVAGPRPTLYYFVAKCDSEREFRSHEVIISSRSSHSRNFDLGTLVESVP